MGPLKMTKTPNLTLIDTDNVFVLGPFKMIKISKLSSELYCICFVDCTTTVDTGKSLSEALIFYQQTNNMRTDCLLNYKLNT